MVAATRHTPRTTSLTTMSELPGRSPTTLRTGEVRHRVLPRAVGGAGSRSRSARPRPSRSQRPGWLSDPVRRRPRPTTFYVDIANGTDRASGEAPGSAWRSLGRATARLEPGDRLLLHRGGRWLEPLVVGQSGTPDRPIVIGAYGRGARPEVRAAAPTSEARSSRCVTSSSGHATGRECASRAARIE